MLFACLTTPKQVMFVCLSSARFLGLGTTYLDQETAKGPKGTTSELAGLSSHYPFFMLNVKQGSCEYDSTRKSNPGLPTTKQTF